MSENFLDKKAQGTAFITNIFSLKLNFSQFWLNFMKQFQVLFSSKTNQRGSPGLSTERAFERCSIALLTVTAIPDMNIELIVTKLAAEEVVNTF